MALRFNKRIKIVPGIKLNVGLKGISTTIGAKGASINVGKKGAHLNTGIPGTGISARSKISGGSTPPSPGAAPTESRPSTAGEKFFLLVGVLAIIVFVVWIF